jgi:hypothetical protein
VDVVDAILVAALKAGTIDVADAKQVAREQAERILDQARLVK